MAIVINFVIDRFCWVDYVWLAASTVRLQESDYSQLSKLQLYRVISEK